MKFTTLLDLLSNLIFYLKISLSKHSESPFISFSASNYPRRCGTRPHRSVRDV